MTVRADVALGSNLGTRAAWLASARAAISLMPATRLLAASSVEETVPFGDSAQAPYLNQMVALHTDLEPHAFLAALQAIEHRLGRVRGTRWGPRTIDLDLVRYGDRSIRSSVLTVPHPGIGARDFWRRELAELDRIVGRAA